MFQQGPLPPAADPHEEQHLPEICGHCGRKILPNQSSRRCDFGDVVYHRTCLPASLNMNSNDDDLVLTHGNGPMHMRWVRVDVQDSDDDMKLGMPPAEIDTDILGYDPMNEFQPFVQY
ncbi:unnamed protein product [Rotaria magnacalcarata]|nr:unnamed protein product [Rotaria magnacalcarata]CAF1632451.1 unnamed protein product [Rotaria magnacalcarata]CAF2063215.1 unnamed protein product [Rotaria magnacalcarata]CAF2089089.1 unnamed protein product [Rotaria magnacalcarata]CAF4292418.1 unnamed protein product [Rotaria magnacalcarata]